MCCRLVAMLLSRLVAVSTRRQDIVPRRLWDIQSGPGRTLRLHVRFRLLSIAKPHYGGKVQGLVEVNFLKKALGSPDDFTNLINLLLLVIAAILMPASPNYGIVMRHLHSISSSECIANLFYRSGFASPLQTCAFSPTKLTDTISSLRLLPFWTQYLHFICSLPAHRLR